MDKYFILKLQNAEWRELFKKEESPITKPFSSIFELNKYMGNSLSEEVNEEEEAPDDFFPCWLLDPFLFIS